MATFKSKQVKDGAIYRGEYEGVTQTATGRIHLPVGTRLTAGDQLLFLGLGQKTAPAKVTLRVVGELEGAGVNSLTGSLGNFQITKNGAPLIVSDGPAPLNSYTSPATSSGSIRATGTLPENSQISIDASAFVASLPDGYVGPVHLGIAVVATAVSATATPTDIYFTVEYTGRNAKPGELSQKAGIPNGAF